MTSIGVVRDVQCMLSDRCVITRHSNQLSYERNVGNQRDQTPEKVRPTNLIMGIKARASYPIGFKIINRKIEQEYFSLGKYQLQLLSYSVRLRSRR